MARLDSKVALITGAFANLRGDIGGRISLQRHRFSAACDPVRPMDTGGAGHGTLQAFREAKLPLAVPIGGGATGHPMTVPMVHNSDCPCLWCLSLLSFN